MDLTAPAAQPPPRGATPDEVIPNKAGPIQAAASFALTRERVTSTRVVSCAPGGVIVFYRLANHVLDELTAARHRLADFARKLQRPCDEQALAAPGEAMPKMRWRLMY